MQAKKLNIVILCLALLFSATLFAEQSATTPVVIAVTDPSGAPVPSAKIRIIPAPDAAPKMQKDSKGRLALDMKPGQYALFVEEQGFKNVVMHFEVRASKDVQTIPVSLQLEHGSGIEVLSSKDDLRLLAYPYHDPVGMSPAALKAMPHVSVTIHNPHTNADESYSGVRLADLLSKLGAPLGNELHGVALDNYIIASGTDGYRAVFSLAEIDPAFHPGEVIVADTQDGKPLDEHSGPWKLVVTEDKRPARCVRNLTTIEVRTSPEPQHYN